ncbi:MAG TPA: hypothetical protein VFA20_16630 [Myxococcaceae bacterium]|nr:hypothetical protein [Myxococcaceae bacterium]
MRAALRAAAGLCLVAASVRALPGPDPHVQALAGAEVIFALLYAWPRAPRWADAGLLAVMAVALAAHAVRGELAYVPAAAAIAIGALWPPRRVKAVDVEDARALKVFQLRGPGEFPHRSHLRVARLYLLQLPLGEAIERFSADIRRFARAKGAATKYHHTITVAFLLLMRARLAGAPAGETFDGFLARNPDLASSGCLKAFYSEAALASELARKDFLFPDRVPSPP